MLLQVRRSKILDSCDSINECPNEGRFARATNVLYKVLPFVLTKLTTGPWLGWRR